VADVDVHAGFPFGNETYMHHTGPGSACVAPGPPAGCHRYYVAQYDAAKCTPPCVLHGGAKALAGNMDKAGADAAFDRASGVLKTCFGCLKSVAISCWAAPADAPVKCPCPVAGSPLKHDDITTELHVCALTGDDAAAGTTEAPLRTLPAAQRAARAARAGTVDIVLHSAAPHLLSAPLLLDARDAGTYYRGAAGAPPPLVTGGIRLGSSAVRPRPGHAGQFMANVSALGLDLGTVLPASSGAPAGRGHLTGATLLLSISSVTPAVTFSLSLAQATLICTRSSLSATRRSCWRAGPMCARTTPRSGRTQPVMRCSCYCCSGCS